jgi:tetratricopeptide (TPR) repeat protein
MSYVDGYFGDAVTAFKTAMEIEKQHAVPRPQWRYLSYYGLSLARADRPTREAMDACERAVRCDPWDPDLLLNLGRVFALAGKSTRALAAYERGLQIAPRHRALRTELRALDRRSTPPLSFLSRSHPLNCALGKIRASLASRAFRRTAGARAPVP